MKNKTIALLITAFLLLGMLAGCAVGGPDPEDMEVIPEETTEQEATPEVEAEEEEETEEVPEAEDEEPAEEAVPEEEPVEEPAEEETVVEEATEPEEEAAIDLTAISLEDLYTMGLERLAVLGDSAPILFPETDVNYLNNFYPGLADIEMKQFYAGVAPVTNAPFEIILVEVANEEDVQTVLDIFNARVNKEIENPTYPENASAWMNNCVITSRGNFVFLAVLMEYCEIPSEFILD